MYAFLFKNIFNPFFEKVVKRRNILYYRPELEESQWYSRNQLDELQWKKLKGLLIHAYSNTRFWRNTFDQFDISPEDINSYQDFQALPLLNKEIINNNEADILYVNHKNDVQMKYTGGSTGNPLKVYYNNDCYEHRVANTKRGYGWAGCEDGRKQFLLWGAADYRETRLQNLKVHLHRFLLRHKYFDCFFFDDARKQECINQLNAFKPEVIIAYPNSLYSLAKYVKEHNLQINFIPKSIISGAEKIFSIQRELIEEVFQAKIFNSYGSREFMLLAMECPEHNGLHLSAENYFIEVLDDKGKPVPPGVQGELVITDLHNYTMPFIRYRIGDLAIQGDNDKPCACGRSLPLIQDVSGRTLDLIKLPDGNEIPGEFFVRFVGNKPGIRQFRVEQNVYDEINIKLIISKDYLETTTIEMEKDLRGVIGPSLKINFQFVDHLALTPTGKFRVTVSNL